MAVNKNTKSMRVFPEDEDFLRDIASERRTLKKDKIEVTPARILRAYINATKQDPKLKQLLIGAKFK